MSATKSPAPTCGSCSSKTMRWSPAASRPRWPRRTASRSSASRARSTRASCASSSSVPDVVVMDYRLPDGEGTEATRRIRVIDGEAAVLLLTGADDPSIVSDALDSGCSGFVSKDRDVDDLVSAIRAVARGAAVFPADLLSRARSARRPTSRASAPTSPRASARCWRCSPTAPPPRRSGAACS